MNFSIGATKTCGQFAIFPKARRALPTAATCSSHIARRAGSSARDFTVRTPNTVSVNTDAFSVSASTTFANNRRSGFR